MNTRSIRASVLSFAVLAVAASVASAALPNGVASGDATQNAAVLWTRSDVVGNVNFVVSTDPGFTNIVGTADLSVVDPTVPVKFNAIGLSAGTQYYYRATDASSASAAGMFRTPAAVGSYSGLRFGVTGDAQGELGGFASIRNAAGRNLDFFVNQGDTMYAENYHLAGTPTASTLDEYRAKHNQVYSAYPNGLNTFKDLRQSTQIYTGIDDHEVVNDFAGGAPISSDPRFSGPGNYINDTQRYQDGIQAFEEYNPIQSTRYGATGNPLNAGKYDGYRARSFGSDASMFLLDNRSFRSQELPEMLNITDPVAVGQFIAGSWNPNRSMLGAEQFNRLKADLLAADRAGTTWKFVMTAEPIQNLGPLNGQDRWDGYAYERNQLLGFIAQNKISNVVFVTEDFHGTLVNNVTYQTSPNGPQLPTGAFEIITGPSAFDKPFGPTLVDLAAAFGLITPDQYAAYQNPPVPPQFAYAYREGFIQTLVNGQLSAFGLDTLGLTGSDINVLSSAGGSTATQTFGWTEFNIDKSTQNLTVTTYGIPAYTDTNIPSNANPAVVQSFTVGARPVPESSAMGVLVVGAAGLARRRRA